MFNPFSILIFAIYICCIQRIELASAMTCLARKRLYTDRIKHFINELLHIKHETNDGHLIHCISTHHMVMDVLIKTKLKTYQ